MSFRIIIFGLSLLTKSPPSTPKVQSVKLFFSPSHCQLDARSSSACAKVHRTRIFSCSIFNNNNNNNNNNNIIILFVLVFRIHLQYSSCISSLQNSVSPQFSIVCIFFCESFYSCSFSLYPVPSNLPFLFFCHHNSIPRSFCNSIAIRPLLMFGSYNYTVFNGKLSK